MKKKASDLGVDLLLIDTGVGLVEEDSVRPSSHVADYYRIFTMALVSAMLRHPMV